MCSISIIINKNNTNKSNPMFDLLLLISLIHKCIKVNMINRTIIKLVVKYVKF